MFNQPGSIKNYHVYQYTHLDYLAHTTSPNELYNHGVGLVGRNREENDRSFNESISEVKKLFKKNGWEGDGHINLIWIPPFIDANEGEDTWGTFLWHVKQGNNGISFIASKNSLPFERLN